ncbi:hypothetical protein VTH06DRAFT_2783 [Thermothelomyces fergusii]
MLYNKLYG